MAYYGWFEHAMSSSGSIGEARASPASSSLPCRAPPQPRNGRNAYPRSYSGTETLAFPDDEAVKARAK